MATALLVVHKRGNDMENFNVLFLDFKAERAPLLALPDILRQKVNFFFLFFTWERCYLQEACVHLILLLFTEKSRIELGLASARHPDSYKPTSRIANTLTLRLRFCFATKPCISTCSTNFPPLSLIHSLVQHSNAEAVTWLSRRSRFRSKIKGQTQQRKKGRYASRSSFVALETVVINKLRLCMDFSARVLWGSDLLTAKIPRTWKVILITGLLCRYTTRP